MRTIKGHPDLHGTRLLDASSGQKRTYSYATFIDEICVNHGFLLAEVLV